MLIGNLYKTKSWKQWKKMDTIHLLINHRSYLDKDSPIKEFDEIIKRGTTFYGLKTNWSMIPKKYADDIEDLNIHS